MGFALALGLWTAVTLLAIVSAVYLVIVFSPDLRDGWRVLLKGRPR